MYSMKEIKNLYKKKINIYSGREEYHYENIIITKHSIERYKERINNNMDIFLALIIINYENIINEINKNSLLSAYKGLKQHISILLYSVIYWFIKCL